ncbi:MAG TPA: hypothetical protein VHQ64_02685 [Pyrinomonadaceae bacterium]|jgi:hypothetical protein|nr:hypothetical protein [Pyrinomonadaceae bacterium]
MTIHDLKGRIKRRPQSALAAAAVFHLMVVVGVFAIGRSGVMPRQFDRDGIGDFASDGHIHKPIMDSLVDLLKQGQIGSWARSDETVHVKVFSLAAVVTEPLFGSNILTIEPVNLLCYLGILLLTFTLAKMIAGLRAAWVATLIVALWPSLLLHTTQFLRDPLVLVAVLTLMTLLVRALKAELNWRDATVSVVTGAAAIYLAWHVRPEMWLVIAAIIFVSPLLLLLKFVVTRKVLGINLLTMALLAVLSIAMPRASKSSVNQPLSTAAVAETAAPAPPAIWQSVAAARKKFVIFSGGAGSIIDETVLFNSTSDIVRYVPRALEIGYFAPFPTLWLTEGGKVGSVGRIVSGFEMLLTYLFEALGCFFVWKTRTRFSSWLLVLATVFGMLALGLVVTNVGTLYRMRYPFWILIVIMAAPVLVAKQLGWFSASRANHRPDSAVAVRTGSSARTKPNAIK